MDSFQQLCHGMRSYTLGNSPSFASSDRSTSLTHLESWISWCHKGCWNIFPSWTNPYSPSPFHPCPFRKPNVIGMYAPLKVLCCVVVVVTVYLRTCAGGGRTPGRRSRSVPGRRWPARWAASWSASWEGRPAERGSEEEVNKARKEIQ